MEDLRHTPLVVLVKTYFVICMLLLLSLCNSDVNACNTDVDISCTADAVTTVAHFSLPQVAALLACLSLLGQQQQPPQVLICWSD